MKKPLIIFLAVIGLAATAMAQNLTLDTLVSFTNAYQSTVALTLGPDGNFYGTSAKGGAGIGSVFRLTTNGLLTTLVSFGGTNIGNHPTASLTLGKDGNLYGTTEYGGFNGWGSIFKISTNGTWTNFFTFGNNAGVYPVGGLVQGSDGNFYGTTEEGPGSSQNGTVFCMTTNGVMTTLVSFPYTNSAYPYGSGPTATLTLGNDGNFYGTTSGLGTYGNSAGTGGTVFRVTPNGVLTTLGSFTEINGYRPNPGALTLGPDSNFYGTTENGGSNNDGTVFQVTTNGVLTTLVSFNGTNGADPAATLTLGKDGNFYGTTSAGGIGSGSAGTVFRVTTNGLLTTLVSFVYTNGAFPNGASPTAGLTLGPDGNFYGTTPYANPSYGTFFTLVPVMPPVPSITGVSLSGTNLVITATGQNAGTYVMLGSTNLLLPLSQWTPMVTNILSGSGNFSTTNTMNPNIPSLYFNLQAH
jgi:uncharacterized repeat protein (TIGR03803 family)